MNNNKTVMYLYLRFEPDTYYRLVSCEIVHFKVALKIYTFSFGTQAIKASFRKQMYIFSLNQENALSKENQI